MLSKSYPSIDNLFKRDQNTHKLINEFKNTIFDYIKIWDVTEKIDGTNIRIELTPEGNVNFGGRTNKAQLATDLLENLKTHFTPDLMKSIRKNDESDALVTLYGEGYGPGIQSIGKFYRDDKFFMLFDVLIDNKWWLSRDQVKSIAEKLNIPIVPSLGVMTISEIEAVVGNGMLSTAAKPLANAPTPILAEGIIARTPVPLLMNNGDRVIFKLKTIDVLGIDPFKEFQQREAINN